MRTGLRQQARTVGSTKGYSKMAQAFQNTQLHKLLAKAAGAERADELFAMISVDAKLLGDDSGQVARVVLAQAMNMLLFKKNLDAVPEGNQYVAEKLAAGDQVVFDHGALRTVTGTDTGALPQGELAFKRFLEPLGFAVAGVYPLPKLKMTGRAYCHLDAAETVAQFFVSELHVDQFSPKFQDAAKAVASTSRDPLDARAKTLIAKLAEDKALPFAEAAELLPVLVGCFDVQHETVKLADYETLLAESAEMAWISTEGNCFNHATDRVADVHALADELRAQGYPMKDKVEVSASGRVHQTAFKASQVERFFRDSDDKLVARIVPGSFYEFITRQPAEEGLDLRFDSSNAQGIFKMTAAANEMC
jgi:hypothetical protein